MAVRYGGLRATPATVSCMGPPPQLEGRQLGFWSDHFRRRADLIGKQEIPALAFLSRFLRAVAKLEWAGTIREKRLDLLRPVLASMDLAELVWVEGELQTEIKDLGAAGKYEAATVRSILAYVQEQIKEEEARQQEIDPLGHVEKMERKGAEILRQVEAWRR